MFLDVIKHFYLRTCLLRNTTDKENCFF